MRKITLAHSPDPDDAFMWWPLADIDGSGPSMNVGEWEFELVMKDIETLNVEAEEALYDITAISIAQYPRVANLYDLTACGASLGDGYGPKLVSNEKISIETLFLDNPTIAVPGDRTTALATLRILAGDRNMRWESIDFTKIMDCVIEGKFDAGVVIHEGQLSFEDHGLYEICDFGQWWRKRTGLLLPLGGNAIRRDFDVRYGAGATSEVTKLLKESILFAMANREKSLAWAAKWGRGIDMESTDTFVEMYVNNWTLDFGDDGRKAVKHFLSEASVVGAVPAVNEVLFV
ncbi:MAG: ABC transporter substrate-binding protein [Planctomycetes bacterium]|nr:ABC transporter substrate-binding protein [Planctomycetota bacterium]